MSAYRYYQNPAVPTQVVRIPFSDPRRAEARYTDKVDEWTLLIVNGENIAREFPEIEKPEEPKQ